MNPSMSSDISLVVMAKRSRCSFPPAQLHTSSTLCSASDANVSFSSKQYWFVSFPLPSHSARTKASWLLKWKYRCATLMLTKYVVSGGSWTFSSTNRLGWLLEASAALLLLENPFVLLFLICSFLLQDVPFCKPRTVPPNYRGKRLIKNSWRT